MKKVRTYKSIESFIVIILMVIVLAGVVILMNSGRIAYSRILDNSVSIRNARTALSYVSMKVRQNDKEESIRYMEGFFNGTDALAIRHSGPEEGMTTYIFHDGTALRETYVMDGREPDPDDGILIAKIDAIEIDLDESKGVLTVKVYYSMDGKTQTMERLIGIRTWMD